MRGLRAAKRMRANSPKRKIRRLSRRIRMVFKLLLFVTLDGWLKISQGLLLSYQ